jgi:hypothetical protein
MELKTALMDLKDAGCTEEEVRRAERLCESGDTDSLIRCLRICRCSRMEELHEVQRKVDRLDMLIRRAAKDKKK